ncbi:helix-turn-helix domain-containing protein [Mesorhizobium sp. NZP2298]|uniref:helix-turn-helix domain-containing protein n=1 Tax=Mesorhizobium sp. NZP2298 TaxID=2483403 RepID=UPI001553C200|nr:AraC family transcriptional regulator [Mesorhizobium sp. NZP2298]QKC97414.1 AraC family transcriptional regulator [Mesorhizobium sp. NZP2298]
MISSDRELDADFNSSDQDLQAFSSTTGERTIATQRGRATYHLMPPGLHTFEASEHVVLVGLEAAPVCATLGGGKAERYDAPAGSIIVKPAHLEARLRLSQARESATIVYPDDSLKELARQQFGPVETELTPPPLGTRDDNALRVAQLLKAELTKKEGASRFHVEQLIAILGIHVLHAYATRTSGPAQFKGGLSRQSAQKLREFLSINLTRKISVDELAALAKLSPKHFTQAFSRTFGMAPHRYLLDLRLDHATRLLSDEAMTIAEVAYLSGFSSQSHLTAAMRKYRGTTPTRFRSSI